MMLKIQICSDLHLEFDKGNDFVPERTGATVLALPGDIHTGFSAQGWLLQRLRDYKHILYLPGNHEYYNFDFAVINREFPTIIKQINNDARHLGYQGTITLLNPGETIIDDVRFLGSTLWSSFEGGNSAIMQNAMMRMNDYRLIKNNGRRFVPADALMAHHKAVEYLEEKLSEKGSWNKTIVLTHNGPSFRSVHPKFKTDPSYALLNGAYSTDLPELLVKADIWFHGHTHDSYDYVEQGCRIICNPRGYFGHELNNSFKADLTIEV